MKRIFKFKIILIFFSLILSEIFVRFLMFDLVVPGVEHEIYFRRQWIKSRKYNIENCYQYDGKLGWDNIPNFFDPHNSININSNGVRSNQEYSYARVNRKKRVLFLGDSFVFGFNNKNNEITSYFLENSLKDTEFINLGVLGYGHDQMFLKLKEIGLKYKPDAVILLYMSLDDIRNIMKFRDYAKPIFKFKNEKLVLKNVPVPRPETVERSEWYHSYILDLIRYLYDRSRRFTKTKGKITYYIIKEMHKLLLENEIEFYIVACNNNSVIRKLNTENMKIWNFADIRYHEKNKEYFIDHWNAEGQKILADYIEHKLLESGYN